MIISDGSEDGQGSPLRQTASGAHARVRCQALPLPAKSSCQMLKAGRAAMPCFDVKPEGTGHIVGVYVERNELLSITDLPRRSIEFGHATPSGGNARQQVTPFGENRRLTRMSPIGRSRS